MTKIVEEMDFSIKITRIKGITQSFLALFVKIIFPSFDLEIVLLSK